jgi:uncharacterized protein YcaQ
MSQASGSVWAMPVPDTLSIDQARRLALAAQGFLGPGSRATGTPSGNGIRPGAGAGAATLRATLRRLGAIQIDSINVVARSHELVLAARVGLHDPAAFERLVYQRRAGFEYWGHAASFLPIEHYRLFLPRMERMRQTGRGWWADSRAKNAHLYQPVLDRVRAEGPLAASAFREPGGTRRGTWWDWAPAKDVLEDLFDQGTVMVHDRVRFERRYDLTERVLPAGLDLSTPAPQESALKLTMLAARALGVAAARDLADYFRLRPEHARPALAEAISSGLLQPVSVQGWPKPAYLLPGTPLPRRAAHAPALLSPFDALIWYRERTERLFGFHYRIEVYTPAHKRLHGYYTMPVLADGRLVARVDPKYDRQAGALVLRGLTIEEGVAPALAVATAAEAAARLAAYLGAERVTCGDGMPDGLARNLTAALAAAPGSA